MATSTYPMTKFDESEVVSVKYDDEHSMRLLEIENFRYSIHSLEKRRIPDLKQTISNLPTLPCRSDDVIICAYVKAGTHWLWEICKMLVSHDTRYEKLPKESGMLEFRSQQEIEALSSPRILNTHGWMKNLPRQLIEKKVKIIFLQRKVKDIAVSMFYHVKHIHGYDGSFSPFLKIFRDSVPIFSNWFDYTLDWEQSTKNLPKDYPIIELFYEDLKRDPVQEIRKISDFLDTKADDDLIKEISEKCEFENMKKAVIERAATENVQTFMYRKGQVGDWKNYFTVAESEEFDKIYNQRMKSSRFKSVLI